MLCPKTVFITGCNRGVGLEFVKHFVRLPNPPSHIVATCREPSKAQELQAIAKENPNVHVVKYDVTDYAALPNIVESTQQLLEGTGLNLLINNAGWVISGVSLEGITPEVMQDHFEVNCTAPAMICQAFLPLLRQAAKSSSLPSMSCSKAAYINISSRLGSMADNKIGGSYPYRASKAALNAVTKSLAMDLQKEDILAAVLNPGWVLTDMGGPNALIDTNTSVEGMFNVMAGLGAETTGIMFDYNGEKIPW